MPSVVFFLKSLPPKITWPAGMRAIVLDPPEKCGGADPLCSTAYSKMYSSLKGTDGRVLPNLLKKYNVEGHDAIFVGFSAAHGFLNPYLNNPADRAATRTVILVDATFGGGKTGYVAAAKDAAAGKLNLVSVTSDKHTTDPLNNGDFAFREYVLEPAGLLSMPQTQLRPPMPPPSEGVFKQGNLWYYRYADAEAHHWELGKLVKPVVEAHVVSPQGTSAGSPDTTPKSSILPIVAAAAALAAGIAAWLARRRRSGQ